MADSFFAVTDAISARVGLHGHVVGTVGFGRDLANYAIPQWRSWWENYYWPGRGHVGFKTMNQPLNHYLTRPLYDRSTEWLQDLADRVIAEGGDVAMRAVVDKLRDAAVESAPVRSGDLRRSVFTAVGDFGHGARGFG